jgi:hypothetical protein
MLELETECFGGLELLNGNLKKLIVAINLIKSTTRRIGFGGLLRGRSYKKRSGKRSVVMTNLSSWCRCALVQMRQSRHMLFLEYDSPNEVPFSFTIDVEMGDPVHGELSRNSAE